MRYLIALCLWLALPWPLSLRGDEQSAPRVALFVDVGTGESREKVASALGETAEIMRLSGEDIRAGQLEALKVDVLIHPGGSGSGQGKALEEAGRESVRRFVAGGGGYVGFCAGAYLATNDYSWSLGLIDARVLDRKHWARGKGPVQVRLSSAGKSLLGIDSGEEGISIFYAQGPLLVRPEWPDSSAPTYESLGIYQSEIAKNGAPSGIMVGTTAIARAEFGSGRVFVFSPHPELTEGLESLVPRAVRWAAGGKSASAGEEKRVEKEIK